MAMKINNFQIVQDMIGRLENLQLELNKVDMKTIEKLYKRVRNDDDLANLDEALEAWSDVESRLQDAIDALYNIEEAEY